MLIASASASAAGGHWYINGEQIGESPVEVAGANQGAFNVGFVVAGVKFNAKCPTVPTGGLISNPVGGSAGILTKGSLVLSSCAVTEPRGNGCTVPSRIEFRPLQAQLTASKLVYTPETGETFFILKVSSCSTTALNGEKPMTGSLTATASVSSPGTYEFTTTSGSALKFGGQTAYLLGNYTLANLSGNPVTVGP